MLHFMNSKKGQKVSPDSNIVIYLFSESDKADKASIKEWEIVARLIAKKYKLGNVSLKYSKYAGCECGCSPGFITNKHGDYDIYADVI